MKEIVIDLDDLKSFERALKEIDDYGKWIEDKTNEICERLADLGVSTAQGYAASGTAYGNTEIEIYKNHTSKNIWRIVAKGEDVYFIEFGAGIGVDASDPFVEQATVEVSDGSYSMQHNGPYFKTGIWHYNKLTLNGIEALKPMYKTQKELEQKLVEIATEVFNSD